MLNRIRRLLGKQQLQTRVTTEEPKAAQAVTDENLLLISDLHLGEACKEHSRIEYLKRGNSLDAPIVSFLEHYAHHPIGERPWRLVLGGDLLDFLQVTTVPNDADAEAVIYGLGTREDESVWKLNALMERHRRFFVHLAAFVGAGHRLEIIRGNHDEELFWPAVQAALLEGLVTIFFGQESRGSEDESQFRNRIHFSPWFFYEPGLIYIEHGHRFDEYCATPPQLCPLRPQCEEELALPLSALAIRYFANLEPGFQTHDKEHWGILDYIRHFRRKGTRHLFSIFGRHGRFVIRSMSYFFEHGRFTSEAAQQAHAEARAEIGRQSGLDERQLAELENLEAKSVMSDFLALFANIGLGEMLTILGTGLLGLIFLFTPFSTTVEIGLLLAFSSIGLSGSVWNRKRFDRNIGRKLERAAEQISQFLDVPVVCFGHSHGPVIQRLPHDHHAFYVNTGSFLGHAVDEENSPSAHYNTYVILERPQDSTYPSPLLHRWDAHSNTGIPIRSARVKDKGVPV